MIEPGDVAAILLAAGRSSRWGPDDKLLASIEGSPLAVRAARPIAALPFGQRIAVCRPGQAELVDLLAPMGFEIVINPDPDRGLSRSIELGIVRAERRPCRAALICLADMPYVDTRHLRALLARFDAGLDPIIASCAQGLAMPPALFSRPVFKALKALHGDQGARALLASASLVAASRATLGDIDEPSDLPD